MSDRLEHEELIREAAQSGVVRVALSARNVITLRRLLRETLAAYDAERADREALQAAFDVQCAELKRLRLPVAPASVPVISEGGKEGTGRDAGATRPRGDA